MEQNHAGDTCARCGSVIRYEYADAGDVDDLPHLWCDRVDGPDVIAE